MFEFVRTHNRLLQILLGLLIFPSFIFFGVSFMRFGDPASEEVAMVDGKKITRSDWEQAHRQTAERLRQQNPRLDPKTLDTPEARRRSLDELVKERVMLAAIHHQNLLVSDERLVRALQTDPQMQAFMQMDAKTREARLRAFGLTEAGYAQMLSDSLSRQQVVAPVTGSAFIGNVEADRAMDALLERREVQWQRFDAKDYADKVQPTDADLQAFHADPANAAMFRSPEQAQIEYVVLDLNSLKSQVTVNEDDLKTYYQQNIKTFSSPEERRASHILVKVAPDASADDKAKAKAKAESLLAQLKKNPAQFAELAKKNSDDPGSAANGGDLDWFSKGAMTPPFEQAVFSMTQGQVSDVVATDFGFHIIQLTGVRGGGAKPFEEVRAQIEDTQRKALAQAKFAELAEQFTNIVYEQGDSLQPAIDKFKLQKQTATVQREPLPGANGPLASRRLLDAVFAPDATGSKHNTQAIETGPSQLVSARVVSYQAARQLPLAEVKDQVASLVRARMALAAAKKDGEARIAELKKDPAATLPQSGVFSRVQRGELAGPALDAALKADLSKGPAATGVVAGNGYVALRVVKALPRDAADPSSGSVRQTLAQTLGEVESEAFFNALKARYKVTVDEAAVARMNAAAAGEAAAAAASAPAK